MPKDVKTAMSSFADAQTADSLATRASLLVRITDPDDSIGWREFYRRYHRLVLGFAVKSGLSSNEAEEVAQEVFARVSQTIQGFDSKREGGSFKAWLLNLARWRIADKYRERSPLDTIPLRRPDESTRTNAAERVPAESEHVANEAWESEWQRYVLDTAMDRLARRVPARHFQIFDLYSRQNWPVFRVARELGVNPATVYVVSHRLTKQLKAEVQRLRERLG